MAQSPRRKSRPGSLPFLRSYPKNGKKSDPASFRTLAQQPNAGLVKISEDTEGEATPTLGELIFGQIRNVARFQDAENEPEAVPSSSEAASRVNDGSGLARMPDPGYGQKPGMVARMLDPNIAWRGTILPLGETQEGEMTWALPEAAVSILRALTLPGDVMSEGYQPSPDELTDLALSLTGLGPLTGSARMSALGSRNARI